jgi:hypothetical protein
VTMIDMQQHGGTVRLITLMHSLSLEINTGMRATKFALIPIAKQMGYKGKAKKIDALRWTIEEMRKIDPEFEVKPSIQKALDK